MNGRERVARKEHRCNMLCGQPIPKGTRYWSENLGPPDHSDNDSWATWKAHIECRDALYAMPEDDHFPVDPSDWFDALECCDGEVFEKALAHRPAEEVAV